VIMMAALGSANWTSSGTPGEDEIANEGDDAAKEDGEASKQGW